MSAVAHMLDAQVLGSEFSLLARRNCSIAPLPMCALFLAAGGISLGIALAWGVLAGAWLVLPFAGIEVGALAVALVYCARRSGDYERISMGGGRLVVEVREGERVRRHEFNPLWVRIDDQSASGGPLALRSHGRELPIGRHLDDAGRRQLCSQLQRLIRGGKHQFDSHNEA